MVELLTVMLFVLVIMFILSFIFKFLWPIFLILLVATLYNSWKAAKARRQFYENAERQERQFKQNNSESVHKDVIDVEFKEKDID